MVEPIPLQAIPSPTLLHNFQYTNSSVFTISPVWPLYIWVTSPLMQARGKAHGRGDTDLTGCTRNCSRLAGKGHQIPSSANSRAAAARVSQAACNQFWSLAKAWHSASSLPLLFPKGTHLPSPSGRGRTGQWQELPRSHLQWFSKKRRLEQHSHLLGHLVVAARNLAVVR